MSGTTGGTSATTVNDPSVDHDDPTGELDPDKLEHDKGVILGTTAEAIRIMAQSGMIISSEEFASARQIMPKVSAIAET